MRAAATKMLDFCFHFEINKLGYEDDGTKFGVGKMMDKNRNISV